MLRFISYTRVSTDDQADYGTGLETQSLENRLYVERLQGALVGEESDPGVSGTIYPRPGLTRALERLQRREADALIVHRVDRLGRKLWVCSLAQKHIQDLGVRLYSAEDGEVTEDNIILFALRCGLAQTDYQGIVKRMAAGKRRQAEKGLQPQRTRPPYGYHVIHKIEQGHVREDAGKYEIIAPEAEVVQTIFALYSAGVTLGVMARQLQAQVEPPGGGARWYVGTLSRILRNPIYAGTAVWGKTRKIEVRDTNGKRKQVPIPEHQHIQIPVPPIVDASLWKACQKRLEENREQSSRHDRTHLFTGLVVCPKCGRRCGCSYASRQEKRYYRYRCPQHSPSMSADGVVCNNLSYYQDAILAAVRKVFERIASEDGFLHVALKAQRRKQSRGFDEAEYQQVLLALMTLDKREEDTGKAHQEALSMGAGASGFKRLYGEIAQERKRLEAKRDHLEELREAEDVKLESVDVVMKFAPVVLQVLDSDRSETEKNQYLRQGIERILPDTKGFKVVLRAFPGLYL